MTHPLINKYCTVNGLQSPAARVFNGRECFVVKVDPANSERLAVCFTFDLGAGDGKFMSLKPDNLTPKYGVEVRPSKYGNGLFATKDFAKGEIIIAEQPFLSFKGDLDLASVKKAVDGLSEPEREALEGLTVDGASDSAIGLMTSIADPKYTPWLLRMKVNSLGASDDSSSLYPVICRINHCCSSKPKSNVWWYATEGKKPRTVTAARDIKAGEELLSDYAVTKRDKHSRIGTLKRYGIASCDCALCSPSEALSKALDGYDAAFAALNRLSTSATQSAAALAAVPADIMTLDYINEHCANITAAIDKVKASFPPNETPDRLVSSLLISLARVKTEAICTLFRAVMVSSTAPAADYPAQLFEAMKAAQQEGLALKLASCSGNVKHPYYEDSKGAAERDAGNFSSFLSQIKRSKK